MSSFAWRRLARFALTLRPSSSDCVTVTSMPVACVSLYRSDQLLLVDTSAESCVPEGVVLESPSCAPVE